MPLHKMTHKFVKHFIFFKKEHSLLTPGEHGVVRNKVVELWLEA